MKLSAAVRSMGEAGLQGSISGTINALVAKYLPVYVRERVAERIAAIEEQAQVRHVSRLFLHAAHLRVPYLAVVLRKGYGLGAMAMAGGGFHVPVATVAWPSGEFGAMGIEGSVKLGFSKELAAAPDAAARDQLFRDLVEQVAERGRAINMASLLEIDAVIDPADTRSWISRVLAAAKVRDRGNRPVDSW